MGASQRMCKAARDRDSKAEKFRGRRRRATQRHCEQDILALTSQSPVQHACVMNLAFPRIRRACARPPLFEKGRQRGRQRGLFVFVFLLWEFSSCLSVCLSVCLYPTLSLSISENHSAVRLFCQCGNPPVCRSQG